MKTNWIACILLFIPLMGFSGSVNSELTGVRLFLWGAEISRTSANQVEAGINEVVFTGLPVNMDANSIQVKGVGSFSVLSVSHRHNFLDEPAVSLEVKMLTDSLELLKKEMDSQQSLLNVYEEEQGLLLANKAIGGSDTGVKVAELQSMANFFRSRLMEVKRLQIETKQKLVELQRAQSRIRNQINELGSPRTNVSEIVVTTSASRAVRGIFEISFITWEARWNPLYDIRASDTGNPVELVMKASVTQSTGEDWSGISLTLSTAPPFSGRNIPELSKWFLRFLDPNPFVGASRSKSIQEAPMMAPEMYRMEAEVADDMMLEMITDEPVVVQSQTTTTHEYRITTPFNVKSGGGSQMLEVQTHELPATFTWYSVPKIDQDAYLVAMITDWEEHVILPGETGVFFENAFVGETMINPMLTDDTLKVSMGTDRGVVLERKREEDFASRGILGRKTTETVAWKIDVRNNKNRRINIEIRDQIPVSTDENIEITLEERAGAQYEQLSGMLTWRLELEPGQSQTLPFRYSVKYPSDKNIRLE
jgi:uncharacterized protein (TIGR02231 family)